MSKYIVEEPAAQYGITYTYADYLKFEYEEMVELIRGKIFKMSPAPRTSHQRVSLNLTGIFFNWFRLSPCQVFHAPTDIVLPVPNKKKESSTTVVQPDLCVICDVNKIEELCVFGAPDLIIEILSPHTRKKDLQNKYEVYEESGVREYWIVMPEERLVELFVLQDGKYKRIQTYTDTDVFSSAIFPELSIDLKEVFNY